MTHRPRLWFLTRYEHRGCVRLAIYHARDALDAKAMVEREPAVREIDPDWVRSHQIEADLLTSQWADLVLRQWFRADYVRKLRQSIDTLAPWAFAYGHRAP
jgi:hypothetical protein